MKTSTILLPFLTAALSLIPSTYAHGFVHIFSVDGKDYKGNTPEGGSNTPSPIRQVSSQDPLNGAKNPSVNCGAGAPNAELVVDAMPGSTLSWDWRTAALTPWPHDSGPMMTYLASCGSTTCDKFDARTAKWFKIDQAGQDGNGGWIQKQLMSGAVFKAKLPDNLAPGQYLVRHEIIALHLANEKGGAEFYPSCQQIKVGGNGSGVPSQDQLLTFPGSYSEDDPGIFTPGLYDGGFKYVFPGGPIAKLVTPSDGGNNDGTGEPANDDPSSCSLKKNKSLPKRSGGKNRRSDIARPHRMSRVMGRMFHGATQ